MAVEIGTATDHVDLYNKLYNFLTANPDLVAANQQWERIPTVGTPPPWTTGGTAGSDPTAAVMLRGPGLAGQEEVFVSMALRTIMATRRAGFYLAGHFAVNPAVNTYLGHIQSSLNVGVPLWFDQPMGYWFVASGRRFMGVINCSGVYMSFYAGLYLPYASPAGNPYPLAIGGSLPQRDFDNTWVTTTDDFLGSFVDPWIGSDLNSYGSDWTTLRVVGPGDGWVNIVNARGHDTSMPTPSGTTFNTGVHPFGSAVYMSPFASNYARNETPPTRAGGYRYLRSCYLRAQQPLLGGGYLLTPLTIFASRRNASTPGPRGVWGVLDGIYHVSGHGNSAENIITVGGVDHLVSQIAFRNSPDCFFAMALE